MDEVVFDASAVLALVYGEPGADVVKRTIDRGIISCVNLSEVIAKLTDEGWEPTLVRSTMDRLDLRVVAFDEDQAYLSGLLRTITRPFGLSLGDRACLALAQSAALPTITGERRWADIPINVKIQLIR